MPAGPVAAPRAPGPSDAGEAKDDWQPARSFVRALIDRDYASLEASLDPEVRFRALVPSGLMEREGARATSRLIQGWFKDVAHLTALDRGVNPIAHRAHVWYRLEETYSDGEIEVIEQNAFCEVSGGRISSIDLVCSGHLPAGRSGPTPLARRFDAGDLGCGSGLPQEFRRQIGSVPLGGVLEVRAKDPSAKEDLPALARLLGHKVRSVQSTPEGDTLLVVERGR